MIEFWGRNDCLRGKGHLVLCIENFDFLSGRSNRENVNCLILELAFLKING